MHEFRNAPSGGTSRGPKAMHKRKQRGPQEAPPKMVKRLVLGMAGCFVFSHFLVFYPNISRELSDLFVLSFVQYLLVCVVFNNIFTIFSFSISQAMATLFIIYSFSMR